MNNKKKTLADKLGQGDKKFAEKNRQNFIAFEKTLKKALNTPLPRGDKKTKKS